MKNAHRVTHLWLVGCAFSLGAATGVVAERGHGHLLEVLGMVVAWVGLSFIAWILPRNHD